MQSRSIATAARTWSCSTIALPDANGLDVLKQIKDTDPDTLVIMLTANTEVGTAVAAMKQGAFHYANKPFDLDEIMLLVEKALETTQLRREVRTLRARQAQPYGPESIVGQSDAIKTVRALLHKIAVSPASTVLLTGESGTGKDLAAKVIHYSSARAAKPFMNITCSALPETLLESELFGHERGAFTGADRQKRGLIETADGGTVFLDEIGEMVPLLQAKLLRFLEEKAFKRVGGSADIKVDVRVIAATNRSLEEEVKKGRFREDLYYRLNVMAVPLPPLRDRRDDIPALINSLHRHLQRRVPQEDPRRLAVRARGAAVLSTGPATCASCATPSSARCCLSESAELNESNFPVLSAPGAEVSSGMNLPAERHQPRRARTIARRPGARAIGLESDQGGDAARPQPRSDPLPHRKVRARKAAALAGVVRRRRQEQRHDRAAAVRAGHLDPSTLQFRQALGRGHAETGAARLGGLERTEQRGTNFSRDAGTGVRNLDRMPAIRGAEPDADRAAAVHRLRRIDQQVLNRNCQHRRIAAKRRRRAFDEDLQIRKRRVPLQ